MFSFQWPEHVVMMLAEMGQTWPMAERACTAAGNHFSDWFLCAIFTLRYELFVLITSSMSKATLVTLTVLGVALFWRRDVPLRLVFAFWIISLLVQDYWYPHFLIAEMVRLFSERYADANEDFFTFGILFLVAVAWLLALLFWAAQRSRERLLFALCLWAVVWTVFQFHYLFTSGAMMSNLRAVAALHEAVAEHAPDQIAEHCRLHNLVCAQVGPQAPVTRSELDLTSLPFVALHADEFWTRWNQPLRASRYDFGRPRDHETYFNTDIVTGGPYILLIHFGEHQKTVILDRKGAIIPYESMRMVMMVQMGVAHGVWFLGFLMLVRFHRRFVQRRAAGPVQPIAGNGTLALASPGLS